MTQVIRNLFGGKAQSAPPSATQIWAESKTPIAYSRCNSGHYFIGEYCPLDGYSSPASAELTDIVEKLHDSGVKLSIEEIAKAGASQSTLERTIVVDFGSEDSVFDAIVPEAYSIRGKFVRVDESGLR